MKKTEQYVVNGGDDDQSGNDGIKAKQHNDQQDQNIAGSQDQRDSAVSSLGASRSSNHGDRLDHIVREGRLKSDIPAIPSAILYVGGACHPNPGTAGVGIVINIPDQRYEQWYGLCEADSTLNRAALLGLQTALLISRDHIENGGTVKIFSDSLYAINAIRVWSQRWQQKSYNSKDGDRSNLDRVFPLVKLYQKLKKRVILESPHGLWSDTLTGFASNLAKWAIMQNETGWRPYEHDESETASEA